MTAEYMRVSIFLSETQTVIYYSYILLKRNSLGILKLQQFAPVDFFPFGPVCVFGPKCAVLLPSTQEQLATFKYKETGIDIFGSISIH